MHRQNVCKYHLIWDHDRRRYYLCRVHSSLDDVYAKIHLHLSGHVETSPNTDEFNMLRIKKGSKTWMVSHNITFVATNHTINDIFDFEFDHLKRVVFSLTTVSVASRRKGIDVIFKLSEHEGKI